MIYYKFVRNNIRRAPYQALAAIMIMFLTFLSISLFLILATGSQQILKFYESKPQAIAFFKDGTTEADVLAIQLVLEKTEKITGFHYVSKEEALNIYRDRNQNNPLLLELVTANILPASLEISTKEPGDLKLVAEIIKDEPVVEDVVFPEDVVAQLTQATRLIRIIGGTVVAFLVTFSTLIIVLIIGFKIRIKRDEIETMKLLGASGWFIKIPYLLEGMFYSACGAFLGWIISVGTLWYFEPFLKENLGDISSQLFPISPLIIGGFFVGQLVIALLVGGLGALVAVRRYLRL